MVYSFLLQLPNNARKLIRLPNQYERWIKDYNYPRKNSKIRTLDGKVFDVRILKIGCYCYMFNGWPAIVKSLNLLSKCKLLFQYEESLSSFQLIYFYQEIPTAPGQFFYTCSDEDQKYKNRLHVNHFFVHQK